MIQNLNLVFLRVFFFIFIFLSLQDYIAKMYFLKQLRFCELLTSARGAKLQQGRRSAKHVQITVSSSQRCGCWQHWVAAMEYLFYCFFIFPIYFDCKTWHFNKGDGSSLLEYSK